MASGPTIFQSAPSARLNGIKFELMTGEEMELFSSVSILEVNDLVDAKLGLPSTSSQCTTCGSTSVKDCDGHFGVIKLPISVYHPYFLPEIVHILNQICPGCKSFRHESRIKRRLFHSVRKKLLKYIRLRLSRLTIKVLSGDLKDDISYLKIRKVAKAMGIDALSSPHRRSQSPISFSLSPSRKHRDDLGSWPTLFQRHRFLLTMLALLTFLCTIYLYFAVTLGTPGSCSGLKGTEKALCEGNLVAHKGKLRLL